MEDPLLHYSSTMPYERLDKNATPQAVLPQPMVRLYRVLKALSQCQVLLGLVCVAMASLYLLNDGVFGKMSVGIVIGGYFALTGFIGICGSASFRRGLMITFMVMSMHSALICVPLLIFTNVVAMSLDAKGCFVRCRVEDLTCGLTCQGDPAWHSIPNDAGRSIDIAQITLAVVQFILSVCCTVMCCYGTCERFGLVNELSSLQILRLTLDKDVIVESTPIPVSSIEEPSEQYRI